MKMLAVVGLGLEVVAVLLMFVAARLNRPRAADAALLLMVGGFVISAVAAMIHVATDTLRC